MQPQRLHDRFVIASGGGLLYNVFHRLTEALGMDVRLGDRIQVKKPHPCGNKEFEVLRVGMDFKIKCTGCGRQVMLPRNKIEKNIKKIIRDGEEVN
jgi:hypothetical protein